LIDRIRHDIQERLDQLLAEADKLRHALAALDPRSKPAQKSTPPPTPKSTQQSAPAAPPEQARSSRAAGSRARTAPGATKAKVLAALSADSALTAGEVAKATGLARGTVSTTLSKLAKSGEVAKAERGYRLPTPS
jgi:DNA-binding transcriptional ArsR family regulator